jgi:hypothetical protein
MRPAAHLLLLFGLARSGVSGAQTTAAAAAVVDSFFRARAESRWHDAARLLDLEGFAAWRDQQVEFARRPRTGVRRLTATFFLAHDPKMPRAVAEYQAKRYNEQAASPPNWVMYDYARVRSWDELAALPPEEAAARWIEGHDVRWMPHRSIAEQERQRCNVSPAQERAMMDSLVVPAPRVLGALLDGPAAYVLATAWGQDTIASPRDSLPRSLDPVAPVPRRAAAHTSIFPPQVVVLRDVGGRWLIEHDSMRDRAVSLMVSTCPGSKARGMINDQR